MCSDETDLHELRQSFLEQQSLFSKWKVCSWHKNQRLMQVGHKGDETGWYPYEICRENGAMIVTGHEHNYARSHLLEDTRTQKIAERSSPYNLKFGTTIVVVNGLGGHSIRNTDPSLVALPFWAATFSESNNANFGALFCKYNLNGNATRAYCYFKDIYGKIPDSFELISVE